MDACTIYIHISRQDSKPFHSLSPSRSRPNTPSHFNISFSNPNHEESRPLHGDFKLIRRFGGDFK
ncbi:hypothetical protein Hanom_Chr04g00334611 [Helianthus anomalus]